MASTNEKYKLPIGLDYSGIGKDFDRIKSALKNLKIDESGVVSAKRLGNELKSVKDGLDRSAESVDRFNRKLKGGQRSATLFATDVRGMRGAMQGFGYQIQDVAVQLAGGQNALLVFTQQGSQMASLFGPGGAIAGAILAIAGALGLAFLPSIFDSKNALEKLNEVLEATGKVAKVSDDGVVTLTTRINELAEASTNLAKVEILRANLEAIEGVKAGVDGVIDTLDDVNLDNAITQVGELQRRLEGTGVTFTEVASALQSGTLSNVLPPNIIADFITLREVLKDISTQSGITNGVDAAELLGAIADVKLEPTVDSFGRLDRMVQKLALTYGVGDTEAGKFLTKLQEITGKGLDSAQTMALLDAALVELNTKLALDPNNLPENLQRIAQLGRSAADNTGDLNKEIDKILGRYDRVAKAIQELAKARIVLKNAVNEGILSEAQAADVLGEYQYRVGLAKTETLKYNTVISELPANIQAFLDAANKVDKIKLVPDTIGIGELPEQLKFATDGADEFASELEQLARRYYPIQNAQANYSLGVADARRKLEDGIITQKGYNDEVARLKDELRKVKLENISQVESETFMDALINKTYEYQDSLTAVVGTLKSMADQGSDTFKALETTQAAMQAVVAYAQGDYVGAIINAIQAVNASDIFGGGGNGDALAARAVLVGGGSGTLLGSDQASSSIIDSLEHIEDYTGTLVNINTGMLKELQKLSGGIQGVSTAIARNGLPDFRAPSLDSFAVREGASFGAVGALEGAFGGIGPLVGFDDLFEKVRDFDILGGIVEGFLDGASEVRSQGVQVAGDEFADILNDVIVRGFQITREKRNLFSKSKTKLRTEDIDGDIVNSFQSVFDQIGLVVTSGAQILGRDIDAIQAAFQSITLETANIDLKDLSPEEQFERLQNYFSATLDQVAEGTLGFLQEFQINGEGAGETLTRLVGIVVTVDEVFRQLGRTLPSLSQAGDNLKVGLLQQRETFVQAAGGIEQLSASMQTFNAEFLTADEQFSLVSDSLTDALADLGEELPTTREGFADLAKAMNVGSESTAENAGALTRLFDLAAEYYDFVEDQQQEVTRQAEALAAYLATISQTVRDRFLTDGARFVEVGNDFADALRGFGFSDVDSILGGSREGFLTTISAIGLLTDANFELGGSFEGMVDSVAALLDIADTFFTLTETQAEDAKRNADKTAGDLLRTQDLANGIITGIARGVLEAQGDEGALKAFDRTQQFNYLDSLVDEGLDTGTIETLKHFQQVLYDVEDKADRAAQAEEKRLRLVDLANDALGAEGRSYLALQLRRGEVLAQLDDEERWLQERVYTLQDAANTQQLQLELMRLQGNEQQALAISRELELRALSATDQEIQKQIYALEDLEAANKAVADAARDAAEIEDQRANLLIRLYRTKGDEAAATQLTRQLEREKYDASLQSLLTEIYRYEDLNAAREQAIAALEEYYNTEKDLLNEQHEIRMENLNNELDAAKDNLGSISRLYDSVTGAFNRIKIDTVADAKFQRQLTESAFKELALQIKSGQTVDADIADDVLSAISNPDTSAFGSAKDFEFFQLANRAELEQLAAITGSQLSDAEKTVKLLEESLETEKLNHEASLERLENYFNTQTERLNTSYELDYQLQTQQFQQALQTNSYLKSSVDTNVEILDSSTRQEEIAEVANDINTRAVTALYSMSGAVTSLLNQIYVIQSRIENDTESIRTILDGIEQSGVKTIAS